MDRFVIRGGGRLCGRLPVNGSKNAALPEIAAALLTDEPVTLRDVPELNDIDNMTRLLRELGCEVERGDAHADEHSRPLTIRTADPSCCHARYEIVRTMRASICCLGPMLARRGQARISMPGGCAIGDRPVDLHLRGLEKLGAEIELDSGDIVATTPGRGAARLRGARVFLGGPFGSTVLGTANVMAAATLAEGTTLIESAACEPEVVDLARMLTAMGARISGAGSPRIIIEGVERLWGVEHRVMPDRIEAGTFMAAAAITNGDVTLENCPYDSMLAAIDALDRARVLVEAQPDESVHPGDAAIAGRFDRREDAANVPTRATVRVTCGRRILPMHITTQPHPGFPTDLQAQFMALLCLGEGDSVVTEKIYPERFMHVPELSRMGAMIHRQGPTAVVSGVRTLVGAPVMASDLRASASLVIAGLAAEGTTIVNRVYHLDRGYERMEERLRALGADIAREDDRAAAENAEEPRGHVVVRPVAPPVGV